MACVGSLASRADILTIWPRCGSMWEQLFKCQGELGEWGGGGGKGSLMRPGCPCPLIGSLLYIWAPPLAQNRQTAQSKPRIERTGWGRRRRSRRRWQQGRTKPYVYHIYILMHFSWNLLQILRFEQLSFRSQVHWRIRAEALILDVM